MDHKLKHIGEMDLEMVGMEMVGMEMVGMEMVGMDWEEADTGMKVVIRQEFQTLFMIMITIYTA
jgi:hypothetical protein